MGSYPTGASPYGVLDMVGNTWEWINDWYQADYYSLSPYTNPLGPASGVYRMLRGGGWNAGWLNHRSANRASRDPLKSANTVGFRCASNLLPGR